TSGTSGTSVRWSPKRFEVSECIFTTEFLFIMPFSASLRPEVPEVPEVPEHLDMRMLFDRHLKKARCRQVPARVLLAGSATQPNPRQPFRIAQEHAADDVPRLVAAVSAAGDRLLGR